MPSTRERVGRFWESRGPDVGLILADGFGMDGALIVVVVSDLRLVGGSLGGVMGSGCGRLTSGAGAGADWRLENGWDCLDRSEFIDCAVGKEADLLGGGGGGGMAEGLFDRVCGLGVRGATKILELGSAASVVGMVIYERTSSSSISTVLFESTSSGVSRLELLLE